MRTLLLSTLALLASAGGHVARAQDLPQDPAATMVATTPAYSFHVDFWHNFHDYLYWRVQDDGPTDEGEACIASRPVSEQNAWRDTEAYYRQELKERHWRNDPVMRAMRYTLSGEAPQPDSLVAPVFGRLLDAADTYRACFWDRHAALARARIDDLVPLLLLYGPILQQRLAGYYQAPWPSRIHVDVVPFASFAGANTASGRDVPPHMQISSIDPDLAGLSGVELLLHEASHEVFGLGRGLVGETIVSVSRSLGVRPPRDLWHAVSFYTSGWVMQEELAKSGATYAPYWTKGLFQRAWPTYLEPIQTYWTPYLRGEVGPAEALRGVVTAIGN